MKVDVVGRDPKGLGRKESARRSVPDSWIPDSSRAFWVAQLGWEGDAAGTRNRMRGVPRVVGHLDLPSSSSSSFDVIDVERQRWSASRVRVSTRRSRNRGPFGRSTKIIASTCLILPLSSSTTGFDHRSKEHGNSRIGVNSFPFLSFSLLFF